MTASLLALAHWLHHYTVAAMVAVFVATFLSLYWPGRKEQVERPGRIPLEDDE
ncbi:MAG TPA: CcoQ/FixQ family Cbb3-type cytochrome c oxidase assembly chaperone [Acetobacteraceae bacterium]|nr:CcoQ/FixQ family Cbb3-type cytochrome c oxidase assembly chaperone [Acetobacteraceae bacterium]